MSQKIKLTSEDKKKLEIFKKIDNTFYNGYMLGMYYGYPSCCIIYFLTNFNFNGSNSRQKYSNKCIKAGNGSGFIPCPGHAKEINEGKIKLEDCFIARKNKNLKNTNNFLSKYKIELEKLFDNLLLMDKISIENLIDNIYATKACKISIKAGQKLSIEEMQNLINN